MVTAVIAGSADREQSARGHAVEEVASHGLDHVVREIGSIQDVGRPADVGLVLEPVRAADLSEFREHPNFPTLGSENKPLPQE